MIGEEKEKKREEKEAKEMEQESVHQGELFSVLCCPRVS
jgi:hypothetical protein